jgi:hypothetical protein
MPASPRAYGFRGVPSALLVGAALLCMLTAVGCLSKDAQNADTVTRPDGIITGTLILEYSLGGSGWQAAVLNYPGRGRLELVSAGKVVASVTTGTSGGFQVEVPVGRYRFHLAESRRLCATDTPPAPLTFTVRPGRANQVQVFCTAGRYGRSGRTNGVRGKITGIFLMVGGPAGVRLPLPGQVIATSTDGQRFTVSAGRSGRFTMLLPPGSYNLTGYSPRVRVNGQQMRCLAVRSVRLKAGESLRGIGVFCSVR